jgi:hypothetical protein
LGNDTFSIDSVLRRKEERKELRKEGRKKGKEG